MNEPVKIVDMIRMDTGKVIERKVAWDHEPSMSKFGITSRRAKQTRPLPASRLSSPTSHNIPLYRNSDLTYKRHTLARDKGRIAIVTNRGLGSDGRDGVGRDRRCRAALAVSDGLRAYDTAPTAPSHGFGGEHTPPLGFPAKTCADGEVVWSWRPGSVRQVKRWCLRPDRARASVICKATGAIVQRSPRRARRTPLKPFAQGRPGDRRHLWSTPCAFLSRTDLGCQPAPGLPCALVFTRAIREAKLGRNAPRECDRASAVWNV